MHPVDQISLTGHSPSARAPVCLCKLCVKARLQCIGDESLLDPLETNWQFQLDARDDSHFDPRPHNTRPVADDVSDRHFRHSGWSSRREAIDHALQTAEVPEARLRRFRNCGSNCWVLRDPVDRDRFRLAADYCHDRFCLPCSAARSRTLAANLGQKVADVPHRFLTLTLRSAQEPLADLLKRLYQCFTALRRRKEWSRYVDGGAAFVEVKWYENTQRWHPHLHLVCSGRYFPAQKLSELWYAVTKDSFVTKIKLIRNREQTLRYVVKYSSKAYDESFVDLPARLLEAIEAFKGLRFCLTFGNWRGVKLTQVLDQTRWEIVAPLAEVRERAAAGDAWASQILNKLTLHRPWLDVEPEDPLLWDQ